MSLPRRLTAFVLTLLLAHVSWVGGGSACAMPAVGHAAAVTASGERSGAGMAGMDMSAPAGRQSGRAPAHDHAPCPLPWAPDGCQSMTTCAPLALVSYDAALRAPDGVPSSIAALAVLTPPSEVRAPELPPPRA